MKSFKEFRIKSIQKIWHTSQSKLSRFLNRPTFFALDFNLAKNGWYKNFKDDGDNAYIYESTINGKIATYNDENVKRLINTDDYAIKLAENPTGQQIMRMKETKILIENGYVGFILIDYDPRDFSKDAPSLVIFNAAKDTRGFKPII
jgi:hypothetical protein